jgi:hypothetical protein
MASIEFDDDPCAVQRATVQLGGWQLIVGCMMLNKTHRKQARPALQRIFDLAPIPEEFADVPMEDLVEAIRPCGLYNRRALMLKRMTEDWMAGVAVEKLRGTGPYAWDSYDIFVRGIDLEPRPDMDAELVRYLEHRRTER